MFGWFRRPTRQSFTVVLDFETLLGRLAMAKRFYDQELDLALSSTYRDPVSGEERRQSEERAKLVARRALLASGHEDLEVQRLRIYRVLGHGAAQD